MPSLTVKAIRRGSARSWKSGWSRGSIPATNWEVQSKSSSHRHSSRTASGAGATASTIRTVPLLAPACQSWVTR